MNKINLKKARKSNQLDQFIKQNQDKIGNKEKF